jgi:hypothetical protein
MSVRGSPTAENCFDQQSSKFGERSVNSSRAWWGDRWLIEAIDR